jgi:phosphatidylglycerol:prolipoprotein diacylglycerol transferase
MHPVLFQIGSFVIGTYGLMIVLGLLAGMWLIARLARRRGLSVDFFYDLLLVALLSGFVGARLTFIALNWDQFLKDPLALLLSRQGFVFLGGLAPATAAAVWFARRRRMPVWEVADVVAPGLVLGHAFGRIGCFMSGCCYGLACTPANHPLLARIAVSYPVVRAADGKLSEMFNFAYGSQVMQGLLAPTATRTLPLAPVQLFESAGNALICLALVWAWRRRRFSGQIAALYLVLYSLLRFGLEFLRGDFDRGLYFNGAISTSQIVCVFTLAAGLGLWLWRGKRGLQAVGPEARLAEATDGPAAAKTPDAPRSRSSRRRRKPSPQA